MAGPRNPGGASARPPPGQPGSDDDERTAVDPNPPATLQAKWEEKTISEKSATGPGRGGSEEITAAGDDSGQFLVDTGVTQDEANQNAAKRRIAAGTGETGNSSIDEPTAEENNMKARERARMAAAAQRGHPGPARLAAGKLAVVSGSDRGREFMIEDAHTTVGRGVENDIILTDISVSRKHLRIECEGNAIYIVDLESGNGTMVNQEEVKTRQRLNNGDHLELGNTVMRIECADVPAFAIPQQAITRSGDVDEEARTIAGRQPPLPPPGQLPISERGSARIPRSAMSARDPSKLILPSTPPGASMRAETPPVYLQTPPQPLPPGPPLPLVQQQLPPSRPPMRPTIQGPAPVARSGDTPSVIMALGAAAQPILSSPQMYPTLNYGSASAQQATLRVRPHDGVLAPNPLVANRGLITALSAGAIGLYVVLTVLSLIFDGSGDVAASDSSEEASATKVAASESESDTAPAAAAERTAASKDEAPATATTKQAETADSEPTKEGAKQAAATTDVATRQDAGTQGPATQEVATQVPAKTDSAPKAGPELVVEAGPPTTLAALTTNKVPRGEWGTDEAFIAQLPAPEPTVTAPTVAVQPKPERQPRTAARADTRKTTPSAEPEPAPRVAPRRPAGDEAADEAPAADGRALASARKKAEQLYREKAFSQAASTLRNAASAAPRKEQRKLLASADQLEELDRQMLSARKAEKDNAPAALVAYRKALKLDERLGGAHKASIQSRRGAAAESAAASYMARGNYAQAKEAADVAEQTGVAGARIPLVRRSLEKQAQRLYNAALKLSRSKDPQERAKAASTARNARALVPSESPIHDQATKLLAELKD